MMVPCHVPRIIFSWKLGFELIASRMASSYMLAPRRDKYAASGWTDQRKKERRLDGSYTIPTARGVVFLPFFVYPLEILLII